MLVVCEAWVGDRDRPLQVLLTIAALLSHSGWLLNRGSLRAQALCLPLALNSASCPQLTPTADATDWLKPSVAPGYICVWCPPAFCGRTQQYRIQPHPQVKVIFRYLRPDAPVSLFFRFFTQVHLFIDGSVEGQYITFLQNSCDNYILSYYSLSLNAFTTRNKYK